MIQLPPRSALVPNTTRVRSLGPDRRVLRAGPRVLRRHRVAARAVARRARHGAGRRGGERVDLDRKSSRLNFSHANISYAVFCLMKKTLSPMLASAYR